MGKSKKDKGRLGVVWSTNPDFQYQRAGGEQVQTPEPSAQTLTIRLDRKMRAGKVVTLVQGFIGREEDLEKLGKELKSKCGAGGSVKNREIIVQGDFSERLRKLLHDLGYKLR